VSYALVYQVTDPVAYLTHIEGPTDLLAAISERFLRQAVGLQPLSLLKESLSKSGQPALPNSGLLSLKPQIQAELDRLEAGMVVKELQLRELQQPTQVIQAVKQAAQEEQARIRSFREAQTAATESLVKTYKLAQQLQAESQAYSQALDAAGQRLRSAPPAVDQAQADVTGLNQLMRQQYPLIFTDDAALARKTGVIRNPGQPPVHGATSTQAQPASVSGTWRDRDIMRNRERVDRPGGGS
jgi:regulator of protease activity HflC (stomatin/prohibitin superfamily)